MVEAVFAFSNFLMIAAILAYFYFREVKHQNSIDDQLDKTQQFYEKISLSKDNLMKEASDSEKKLINQTFTAFLKHIQTLEGMVLPKPVTKEMVNDIMLRTPPIVENEIDKEPEEVEAENFMDIFSRLPIDGNTSVAFENEIDKNEVPEEIVK